jgi:hypothetical protein
MSIITEKYIFIHIPKTGGTSLELIIGGSGHCSVNEMIKNGKDDFGNKLNLKKEIPLITIVRNPFQRLISAFLFLKQLKNSETIITLPETFAEVVLNLADYTDSSTHEKRHRNVHFLPQLFFIEGAMGAVDVDDYKLLRTEQLAEDFEWFKKEFHLPESINLPVSNKTVYPKHWKEYYHNQNMIDLVVEHYKEDFEKLGYSTNINDYN